MPHVNTVLGPIAPAALGATAMHEHVLWGPPGWELDPEWWFHTARVLAKCVADLDDFKHFGGGAMVDCSGIGLGRDINLYREVSRRTGVHIIQCTGFWADKGILPWFRERDIDYLEELFVHEITVGIGGSGAKAGIIKVGTSLLSFTDLEQREFRAAARAAKKTGVAVTTHGVEFSEQHLEVLLSEGLDPERIILGHLDDIAELDVERDKRLARKGAYIQYDSIGTTNASSMNSYLGDFEYRAELIKEIVDAGLGSRLLVSADVNSFSLGWQKSSPSVGKAVVGDMMRFLPQLRRVGLSDDVIHMIAVENPQRVLPVQ
jgi:phosphotriesterase-related protein